MAITLQEPTLLRTQAFINGQWTDSADGSRFAVHNPANQLCIAEVANLSAAQTGEAISAAAAALPAWRARPARERSALLRNWYELIVQHRDDLATIMTCEQGKIIAESLAEISYGAAFIEWFAEEAKRVYGDIIPAPQSDRRTLVIKQPVGVCAAITPWNFPNAMIARKAGAALAVGCTMVLKPAAETPLSALALAELAQRAGIPPGVLNIVTGDKAAEIGAVLTASPLVRKLSFTGSTAVGKQLMQQCASSVKRCSMELGGNAPVIVFDDADLDLAVRGAAASKYRNSGQTCICANRLLVQQGIYPAFVAKLQQLVARYRLGDGINKTSTHGPLIHAQAAQHCHELVEDALAKGALAVIGGQPSALGSCYYPPTILTGIDSSMRVYHEEIFGPIAPIIRFADEAEAIALANDTPYGLAAYLYTRDSARSWRVSEAIEYGMVGVNETAITSEVIPFGGIKESGQGREGSKYGIDDYLELKYICIGAITEQ